jgi:hypothetical protein
MLASPQHSADPRRICRQSRRAEDGPPVAAVLNQHCNAVTSWAIDGSGEIKHAYA